ncbi:MAG: ATP-binding protein [Isosphaeraceae bacterium]
MLDEAFNALAWPTEPLGRIRSKLAELAARLMCIEPQERLTGDELVAEIDRLQGQAPRRTQPKPVPSVAHGDALKKLRATFAEIARSSRAGVIYVQGESAVGKTVLIEHFLRELIDRGKAVVLQGKCYRQESGHYKALDVVIGRLRRYWGTLGPDARNALIPRDAASLVRIFESFNRIAEVRSAAERDRAMSPGARSSRVALTRPGDTTSNPQQRLSGFTALRDVLERLATPLRRNGTPLVLAIDDLQWGDLDSAALLEEVLRPPDPPPLILVGCFRSNDRASSFLEHLLAQQRANPALELHMLKLKPLSTDDAHDLALKWLNQDGHGEAKDEELAARQAKAEWIARQSRGLPLFIEVLVEDFQSGEHLAGEVTLAAALWARVSRLSAEARSLLLVVAIAERPIWPDDAYRAAGLTDEAGRRAAMTLRKNRAILSTDAPGRPGQEMLEVYHDSYRAAVLLNLSRRERRALYGRLADAVESSEHDHEPAAKASYHLRAGEPRRAGEWFARAARAARDGLAFDEAVRLYRAALRLTPHKGVQRELRTELAEALAHDGRAATAEQYEKLAGEGDDIASLELRTRAADQWLISGYVDDGLKVFSDVLHSASMGLPKTARGALALLLLHRFRLRFYRTDFHNPVDPDDAAHSDLIRIDICWAAIALSVIDPIKGAEFQARTLLLALRVREPYRVARSLASAATQLAVCNARRMAPRTKQFLIHAVEWARHVKARPLRTHAFGTFKLARGIAAYLDGDWRDAIRLCDQADAIFSKCRSTGVAWEQGTARIFSLWALMYLGDLNELGRRCSDQLLDEVRGRQDLYGEAILRSYPTAVVRLRADDADGAREALREVESLWTNRGYHIQHHNCFIARVLIDLYTGRGRDAWDYIADRRPEYKKSQLDQVQQVRIERISLRAMSALASVKNDPRFFLDSAARDARRLHRERNERSTALALLIEAGVAVTRGDEMQAASRLRDAIVAFRPDKANMALHAAAIRHRLGRLVHDDELVRQAEKWMESQGIKNPARMAAMYTPGAWPGDPAPAGPSPNGA